MIASIKGRGPPHIVFELLTHPKPPALIPAMYLKCPKMVSEPVFRDGVCTSLLEQIYVQRRVSLLTFLVGQANTCSPEVAAVADSQHSLERVPPLLQGAGTFNQPNGRFSSLL
ncbi:hypothetical protein Y032_0498g2511 [Ancylostoma ceylanicum]|uniref:Uncharacterized protein n=1 Tax=Ancylostoma ceylanicum TaxID=53326 RepID=A0A016WU99_9BILA|nr:hypothetical protein Y032_0498g2511 [Ancylostoma ceylanicum]